MRQFALLRSRQARSGMLGSGSPVPTRLCYYSTVRWLLFYHAKLGRSSKTQRQCQFLLGAICGGLRVR